MLWQSLEYSQRSLCRRLGQKVLQLDQPVTLLEQFNQVHLGHNVRIGRDCLICGQCGLSGSVVVGNNVVMGGQCGVNDNIFIGDDVVAGGATKVFTNVPAGRVMLGYPAMKMEQYLEASRNWRRLPRLMDDVRSLKKAVSNDGKDD